jgi:hypothetical protein
VYNNALLAAVMVPSHSLATSSCSGGMLGRPILEYIASSSPSSSPRTSSTILRIRRIG